MPKEIIIVPCTREKIWDVRPDEGEVAASDAYIKPAFVKWRKHAEDSELPWLILSTKYGFLKPGHPISKYEAKVSSAKRDPAYVKLLREQAGTLQLDSYDRITVLDWEAFEGLVKMALVSSASKIYLKKLIY